MCRHTIQLDFVLKKEHSPAVICVADVVTVQSDFAGTIDLNIC